MEEVCAAADAADAAVAAMELLLAGVVVEEVALHAAVAPERDAAGGAARGDGLPGVAQRADDLRHLLAVELVPLLRVLCAFVSEECRAVRFRLCACLCTCSRC